MIKLILLVSLALTALASQQYVEDPPEEPRIENQVPLPPIDLNEWWGPGDGKGHHDTSIRKFKIQFKESMINDLQCRLENHIQSAPPLEGVAFNYGFSSTILEHFVQFWAKKYSFKEREKYLNQYPHYVTNIQGLDIHFMRITSKNKSCKLVPLMLMHGWPGSIREFYESIPYLISIAESRGIALDIIVPSLPGYGFSKGAVRQGLGVDKAAFVLKNMMDRIGYKKFYIQGGDMGTVIGSVMATFFPSEILGFHTNYPLIHNTEITAKLILGNWDRNRITTPEYQPRLYPTLSAIFELLKMTGYLHMHATKPDTIGAALSDSPAGLLAYILEKFSSWVRAKFINYPDGGLTEHFTEVQLLDNIMIYWSTNSITTSMRIYAETLNARFFNLQINEIKSPVPMWVSQAPDEFLYLPGWMIRLRFPNLLKVVMPREGGHFYAWEKPKPFAKDVVNAIVAFEKWHARNSTLYTECSSFVDY